MKLKPFELFMLVLLFFALLSGMTSCRTQGYGCKGKESWNKMVKRINRA